MRHLIRVTGFIIALALLLAIVAGLAQDPQARHVQGEVTPAPTDSSGQEKDTPLVCLALIGGTVLLAGGVWMEKLRRTAG
jgi:Mn2+/Fe2+ NRAMP family transporter